MLRHLRTLTGDRPFLTWLAPVVVLAALQAGAVLSLLPLLDALLGGRPAQAGPWVAAFLGLIAAAWGIDVVAARLGLELGIALMRTVHRRTPGAILARPAAWLTPTRAAALRTLVATGAVEATSAVVLVVTPVITAVVFVLVLGLGLLAVSVQVGLVTVSGGILALGALRASMRIEARAQERYVRATEELDDRLFEFARAQTSLRTARRTSTGRALVDDAIASSRGRVVRLLAFQIPGEGLFGLVLNLVLIGFGTTVWLAFDHGSLSAASASALVLVLLRVVDQITTVSGSTGAVLAVERNLRLVREIVETPVPEAAPPRVEAPHVRVRDLRVSHPDGTPALSGVELDLRPGTVTVVVGPSGAGKTTLIRALAGLLETDGGSIDLEFGQSGSPAAGPDVLSANAAVVFQHTVLGEGTIADNLLAVDPDLERADLERIAEITRLVPVLESAERGWDTPVGELGAHLSGGERQRVGIARALAKPCRLLLVDEATSALDHRNESAVVEAVDRIRADRTTLVVTHRPAVLRIADTVVVMDRGRIVEQGEPAELEAASGEYARLLEQWRARDQWHI